MTEKFPWEKWDALEEKRDLTESQEEESSSPGSQGITHSPFRTRSHEGLQPSRYLAKKPGTLTQLQRV